MAVRKTKGKAPAPKVAASKPVATAPSKTGLAVSHQDIAERAYLIWKACGCPHGQDCEHWFQAERELRGGPRATAA